MGHRALALVCFIAATISLAQTLPLMAPALLNAIDLTWDFAEDYSLGWPILTPFKYRIKHRGWYDQPKNTTYIEFNDISGSEHVRRTF